MEEKTIMPRKQEVLDFLRACSKYPGLDETFVSLLDKNYSLGDAIKEIENGTKLGQVFYRAATEAMNILSGEIGIIQSFGEI